MDLKREQEERAGCVQLRRNRRTGTVVGIYLADEAGLCPEGGEFITVCEDHGFVCNHESMRLARDHATDPTMWCESCQEDVRCWFCDKTADAGGCDGCLLPFCSDHSRAGVERLCPFCTDSGE